MEDLGKRLWEQFEEIIQNQIDNRLIFQLRITPEEVQALHSVAWSFGKMTYEPVRDNIKKYWKYEGLIYLLLFTFTKYVHTKDIRFWEGWEQWTRADTSSDLHNHKIYYYIKSFSDKYNLFLYCPNRNEYVSSLRTHAFLGHWTILKTINTLFFLTLRHPYHLDQYDREAYLRETLEQHAEKPSDNSEDDDDQDLAPFAFRKSFRMASSLQKAAVFDELKDIFRVLHQSIVAYVMSSDKIVKVPDLAEPYIHEALENFLLQVQSGEYASDITEAIAETSGKRFNFRRPGLYLDMHSLLLTLHVPEQRVFNLDPHSIYSVSVESGNQKLPERILDYRYYKDNPYSTREEEIEILYFENYVKWKICSKGFPFKDYSWKGKVLYFRSDGHPIELPLTQEQEWFILVPDDCQFECDGASKAKVEHTNYSIYCVQSRQDTLFFVDGDFISPMSQNIPNLLERKRDFVYRSASIIDPVGETHPVYHSFPGFSIRTKNEKMLRDEYPMYIDKEEINYCITNRTPICDGTDDVLFDIEIPDEYVSKSGISVYQLDVGVSERYSRTICIVQNLSFSFTESLYFSRKEVRVKTLDFDSCDTFLSGSYIFPMKDNNTKFRFMVDNNEYKLVLEPPLIEVSLDGKELPELVWADDVFDKKVCIVSELEGIAVKARLNDKSEIKLNQFRITNNRTISLDTLAQWKYMGYGNVELVLCCNSQEKIITTVYLKFCFLDGPRFLCNEPGLSDAPLVGKDGLYLIGKMIGSSTTAYTAQLTYLATGETYSFPLHCNNSKVEALFITDRFVPNGRCKLEIKSIKEVMGYTNSIESIEYSNEFQQLYEEPIQEIKPVSIKEGVVFEIDDSDAGVVKNFFLRIDDELAGEDGFIAEGFFIHGDKTIYHTEFNPYTITNITYDGKNLTCSIKNNDGQHPFLDRYGRVNPLNTNKIDSVRIRTVLGKILDFEEYTYGV